MKGRLARVTTFVFFHTYMEALERYNGRPRNILIACPAPEPCSSVSSYAFPPAMHSLVKISQNTLSFSAFNRIIICQKSVPDYTGLKLTASSHQYILHAGTL
jgi:hypothetical protein